MSKLSPLLLFVLRWGPPYMMSKQKLTGVLKFTIYVESRYFGGGRVEMCEKKTKNTPGTFFKYPFVPEETYFTNADLLNNLPKDA